MFDVDMCRSPHTVGEAAGWRVMVCLFGDKPSHVVQEKRLCPQVKQTYGYKYMKTQHINSE